MGTRTDTEIRFRDRLITYVCCISLSHACYIKHLLGHHYPYKYCYLLDYVFTVLFLHVIPLDPKQHSIALYLFYVA